ncbi:hypothetical protein GCM10027610_034090 [Dactylosporangium cerinum]
MSTRPARSPPNGSEGDLAHAQLASRMPLPEQVEDGRDLPVVGVEGADGQGADLSASGGGGLVDAGHDLAVARVEPVAQPLTERGEPHAAAGPLEQGTADPALLLFDRLADPRLGHAEAFGRTPEVELFGQCQEDLDVAQLHQAASSGHRACGSCP